MELLRFLTCGSVDDGKSTLIGRLLYDSGNLFQDQLDALEKSKYKNENGTVNLAMLTDGLKAEREQGITIDVAFKYFTTPKRKFIIADSPGHIQYTRNMVTAASQSDVALILIDARKGVIEQTRRHACVVSLMGMANVIVCVNKMDLVDYAKETYDSICTAFSQVAERLDMRNVEYIPISALNGDNIVNRSTAMSWFAGPSLLEYLETVNIEGALGKQTGVFPIQTVIRPHAKEFHDYRGFAGRVLSGEFQKGDEIVVLPGGQKSKIEQIEIFGKQIEKTSGTPSVIMRLQDEIDAGRGSVFVKHDGEAHITQDLDANVCWIDEKPLKIGGRYLLQHGTTRIRCLVRDVHYRIDVNTLDHLESEKELKLNDIGKIEIRTSAPLFVEPYKKNRRSGSFILIDEATNMTAGACMVFENPIVEDIAI